MNANVCGSNKDNFAAEIDAYFQPLTEHVSQAQGFDSYEVIE
jgi:hypothetical protein